MLEEAFDNQQGCAADEDPQEYTLQNRTPAYIADGFERKAGADKEKGDYQTLAAEKVGIFEKCRTANFIIEYWEVDRQICRCNDSENKIENKIGDFDLATAFLEIGSGERYWDDPKGTFELDGSGYLKGLGTVFAGGTNHRAGVVNGDSTPCTELLIGEANVVAENRENKECN